MENKHNDLDASKHGGNAGDLIGIYNVNGSEGDASVSESNPPVS
jgi:hypothetical protein